MSRRQDIVDAINNLVETLAIGNGGDLDVLKERVDQIEEKLSEDLIAEDDIDEKIADAFHNERRGAAALNARLNILEATNVSVRLMKLEERVDALTKALEDFAACHDARLREIEQKLLRTPEGIAARLDLLEKLLRDLAIATTKRLGE